jgi:hypothetical protein
MQTALNESVHALVTPQACQVVPGSYPQHMQSTTMYHAGLQEASLVLNDEAFACGIS